jgi:poly-gamma-glutamate capsule biosynthesis protein CapA/YwtB (metallophosphatase superfamily)
MQLAIGAGADVVVGQGPHYSLLKGRPIYYGLGNLCFKTGHLSRRHENWLEWLPKCHSRTEGAALIISASSATMRAMKPYSDSRRTRPRCLRAARSEALGATLTAQDERVRIAP